MIQVNPFRINNILTLQTSTDDLLKQAASLVLVGDHSGALHSCEAAFALDPTSGLLAEQIDRLLRMQPIGNEAIKLWASLSQKLPANPKVWVMLGTNQIRLGETAEAISSLKQAASLKPDQADIWRMLGGVFAETWQFDQALSCLERALNLEPDNDDCISLLGWVKNEMGDVSGSLAVLAPQNPLDKITFGRRLRFELALPQIYENREDLTRWRSRYLKGLANLNANLEEYCPDPRLVFTLNQTNFLLAYQGSNDLDPQRDYAHLLHRLISQARPDLTAPQHHSGAHENRKIKVAFLSSFLHECTIGHYFRSWVDGLDAARFETTVIYTGGQSDATTQDIARRANRFMVSRGNALEVAKHVLEAKPDILIYLEIGMHSKNYVLANMRLAPIQCAAWGHPVTTGSTSIDYYFTCGAMEAPGADNHYSEKLLRLPGLGTRYRMPGPDTEELTRDGLGLSADRHVYLCPQSLFKVHPDNDEFYFDILDRDRHTVLLFFQESAQRLTMTFANRIAAGMSQRGIPPCNQIKFLPRVGHAAFRSVLRLADVVLDTLHWSGGNTTLDALSVGAPLVTLPGPFMRGRQSAAMLDILGLQELIANSRQQYVDHAVQIATDKGIAQRVRKHIVSNNGELFDRVEPLHELGEHLLNIYYGRPSSQLKKP